MWFYLKTVDVGFPVLSFDCKGMLSLEMFFFIYLRSLPRVDEDEEEVLLLTAKEEEKRQRP